MFNRKINREIDELWDACADLAEHMLKLAMLIQKARIEMVELEHYVDDVSIEVTELQEAVFEDDDSEACDC
jgi:hypothetical protein